MSSISYFQYLKKHKKSNAKDFYFKNNVFYFTKHVSMSTYFVVSCTHNCKYSNNKSLLQCYSIVKIQFKNFYLTIFIALNANMMNKTIKTFTLAIKKTGNI